MPDSKAEWSLKENNSKLHHGIRSKVNLFIYTLVCNYMPNIRILAKRFFKYFVHKVVPIQNACVQKTGVTQPKIYRICSKVNQFIYILVCNYMLNTRILAKAVLQLFYSPGYSYTKCLCPEKNGSNSTKMLIISSTLWSVTIMPNIRILAKAVLQLFCSQGCSCTKCLCLKKESNAIENLWNRFKN